MVPERDELPVREQPFADAPIGDARAGDGPLRADAADGPRSARLVVGLRPGDLRLTESDRRVLRVVAPLLGQVLRAQALAEAVQASRGQVVTAVEDERRRLRRDLHDGLGPTLTGIAFTVDAVRNTLRTDPDGAAALLAQMRADTVAAIEQVRRIVYGMRPPALDELGLVGALRQQSGGLRGTDGAPLAVTVEAAGAPDPLPAAVEVAAYRIVVEALTNAARHSGARRVDVRLSGDDASRLVVEVRDDGAGGGPWPGGVGLASMRERAAEVGGSVECRATPSGGRVLATLPV